MDLKGCEEETDQLRVFQQLESYHHHIVLTALMFKFEVKQVLTTSANAPWNLLQCKIPSVTLCFYLLIYKKLIVIRSVCLKELIVFIPQQLSLAGWLMLTSH
jgi:hypothetical protein